MLSRDRANDAADCRSGQACASCVSRVLLPHPVAKIPKPIASTPPIDYAPTGFIGYGFKTRPVRGHEFGLKLSADDKKALIAYLKTL